MRDLTEEILKDIREDNDKRSLDALMRYRFFEIDNIFDIISHDEIIYHPNSVHSPIIGFCNFPCTFINNGYGEECIHDITGKINIWYGKNLEPWSDKEAEKRLQMLSRNNYLELDAFMFNSMLAGLTGPAGFCPERQLKVIDVYLRESGSNTNPLTIPKINDDIFPFILSS